MKSIKIYITLSILALVSISCQKDLEVPLPEHKSKMVVNAFLNPDAPIELYLSRSYGPLEDTDKTNLLIKDAKVEILKNDSSLGFLSYQDTLVEDVDLQGNPIQRMLGKYTSDDFKIEANKQYSLRITHPLYDMVTAKTFVPHVPEIIEAECLQNVARSTTGDGYSASQSLLRIKIKDPVDNPDQYRIQMAIEYEDPNQPGEIFFEQVWEVDGPVNGKNNAGAYTTESIWLSDDGKDGQTITSDFVVKLPNAYDAPADLKDLNIYGIYLLLYSANNDSYQYLKKLKQQEDSRENGISFFPPEAIVVYTNIENGYGIFGGLSSVFKYIVP